MGKHCSLALAVALVLLLASLAAAMAAAVVDAPPDGSEGRAEPGDKAPPAEAPSQPDLGAGNTPAGLEGYICFQSDRDEVPYYEESNEIYRMNADGSGQIRLTNNSVEDYTCSWSPDGSQIVFASERDGAAEIYVMNAYGDGQKRLTHNNVDDVYPEWSPDGSKIVFASRQDEDRDLEIWTMNPDGTGVTQLTFNTANDSHPSWSPNGKYIAFASERDGVLTEIYRMNADGSAQTRLTYDDVDNWYPQWSPDSTQILYYHRPDDYHEDNEVWRMNADGSDPVQLTSGPGPNWSAVYSPDGRSIAFSSLRDGDREIYVMNADGSGQANITNRHASSDLAPSWIGSLAPIGPGRTITLTGTGFTPDALTVPAGTQVTWYNATGQTHTLLVDSLARVYLPLVMRNARNVRVRAGTAATVDAGRPADALRAAAASGGEYFVITLGPGERFAHLLVTPGETRYHLETSPYYGGVIAVLSREEYCNSQDVITAGSLEAARLALEAGADAVSLSPDGCVRYSRVTAASMVVHEELTASDWTMETWDHTITQSHGLRDADMDGFFEWRSTVEHAALPGDQRVIISMYSPVTTYLARREIYQRLDAETMRVLWEEDTGDGLTLVGDFQASTTDRYTATLPGRSDVAGGPASVAGACSDENLDLIRQRLAEAIQQGIECMHRYGRPDLAVKLAHNYATRPFIFNCASCTDQAQITIWPDPTMPVVLTVCDEFFKGDANWQRSTMFHEMEHLSEPPHDPTIEEQAGDKNWEVDPIYACESLCFNNAASQCSCATCLRSTICNRRCAGLAECNPELGAQCLCPSRRKWYNTFGECAVACPSGLACFGSTCKHYDVSCR